MRGSCGDKFKRECTKDIILSTVKSRIDIKLFCAIICSDARDGILYLFILGNTSGKRECVALETDVWKTKYSGSCSNNTDNTH